jgi:hypothetical protein
MNRTVRALHKPDISCATDSDAEVGTRGGSVAKCDFGADSNASRPPATI